MNKKRKNAYNILTAVLWMLVWQGAALAIDNKIFLPSPMDTVKSLGALLVQKEFYHSVCFSLGNIAKGFCLGIFVGIVLAVLASATTFLEQFFNLPMRVIKAVPVASFTILALFWVDSSELSVLISFFMVVPVIYTNVLTGIKETDKELLEMAKVFHLTAGNRVRFLYTPLILPYLVSASSVAIGLAWKSGIAAEVIGLAKASIGNHLYEAKIYLEMPTLFAWTVAIVCISILSEKLILLLLHLIEKKMLGKVEATAETEGAEEPVKINAPLINKESLGVVEDTIMEKESGTIFLKDISKAYGEKQVLDHVSFTIAPGAPVALMGSSGIGKTTLLRLLLGTERPSEGTIERVPEKMNFSVVFQENRLCENVSVEQNLKMVGTTKHKKEEIERVLRQLGLHECRKQKVAALSGGMKRRVAIGRALIYDAPVFLLDEPFQGLDEATKQNVMECVKARIIGKSFLLITHDKAEAECFGCKIIQL